MLELRQISKKFYQKQGETRVINSLSLKVKRGEIYGFLGPNGAGKTTTVKMIAGLLFPDKGRITVSGHPAGSLEAAAMLGFMSENPQFYRHLKAREVLEFVGELFSLPPDTVATRVKTLLSQVGLSDAADSQARNFSKGMNQRLAFAAALMNNPALLVLDEPLDGLDPLGRLDFKRLIRQWHKEGRTVFFSSHILGDVEELCTRVGIIARGRLLDEGSPKQLIRGRAKSLEEYFVKVVRDNG
jgi:ABC-2 type transport system ATP-binding protein